MSGPYGRRSYVDSLATADDTVVALWGGHALLRPMPDGSGLDAATAYPLGGFDAVVDLEEGLAALRSAGAVSLAVVADPLNAPDLHRRLKTHYILDRSVGAYAPSKHHRYEIRRAQRQVTVDRVALPSTMEQWRRLYDHLADRHAIGPARLTPRHFDALAADPQALVLAARLAGDAAGASYALYAAAIEELATCRLLDLGGMPGLTDDPSHGLARFKRGFCNAERATWLSGFVLDRARYEDAVTTAGADGPGGFFPAYRAR